MPTRFIVGLDLGQTADYTALAALERSGPEKEPTFQVRHLQRYPLGTPYPDVVEDVKAKLSRLPLWNDSTLVVDQTGVGRPVVDMFRKAGLKPAAISITGGDAVTRGDRSDEFRVPKRELAAVGQVLLQTGRLKIAENLPEAATLANELLGFRVKISQTGHDSYEAWREGIHDDLVLAVFLAVWYSARQRSRQPYGITWDGRIST